MQSYQNISEKRIKAMFKKYLTYRNGLALNLIKIWRLIFQTFSLKPYENSLHFMKLLKVVKVYIFLFFIYSDFYLIEN